MQLRSKRLVSVALSSVVAAGGMSVFGAQAAFADPAGCTTHKPSLTWSSSGYMHGKATARCGNSETRTLRVEIKHDLTARPDPVTATNSERHTGVNYSVKVSTCDHGNDATYYSRGFFTSGSDYHDSDHHRIRTCS